MKLLSNVLNWFKSYIINKSMIREAISTCSNENVRIPQGTVVEAFLFAEDTTVAIAGDSRPGMIKKS